MNADDADPPYPRMRPHDLGPGPLPDPRPLPAGAGPDTVREAAHYAAHLRDLESRARAMPFFALVQHLERLRPDAPPAGGGGPLRAEAIRFRHDVSLTFHPGDVAALRFLPREPQPVAELTTTFLGIVGAVSPLASFFSEDVLRGEGQDDSTLRGFYDLFHHRLIGLLYRALARSTPAAEIRTRGDDRVTSRSLAIVGLVPAGKTAASLSPRAWLGCARVLGRRPRSRDALEAALGLALPDLPVRVFDFVPRDVPLAADQRAQLGVKNVTLGRGARLGRHLLRQTGLLRLEVGPVGRASFEALAAGGRDHARLRGVVDAVLGGMVDAEIEIEIASGEEPRARLGASPDGTRSVLGVSTLVVRPRTSATVRARVSLTDDAAAERPVFLAPPPA